MNNIAMPARIWAQPCGTCSFLGVECLTNCLWASYIKPGKERKFSLLVEDTSVNSLEAKVKKCRKEIRQKVIDNLYEYKKKMKSEHEKAKAVPAADSESLNQHEGKAVVDVAEDSLNHHEGKAVHDFGFKWTSKCVRTRQPTSQLLLLARVAEIFEVADMFELANDVDQKAKAKQAEKEPASLRNEKAEQSKKEEASLRNGKAEQVEKEQAERPEK